MVGAARDWERDAAYDPRTPPRHLADLASRRWDLHAVIAAHPSAYPGLRQWIAQVNPNALRTPMGAPVPAAPPRRTQAGWWVAGCGCVALLGIAVLAIVLIGVIGAEVSSHDAPRAENGTSAPAPRPGDPVVDEHLRTFESERVRFHELADQLDGNPAAPLVTDPVVFARLEARAAAPNLSGFSAQTLAQQARRHRENVQQLVAAAERRRANTSGSVIEAMVDRAGDGLIDIGWDAATACRPAEREEWRTTACVTKEDSLTVHFLPDSTFSSDWERRMIAAHELAHIYQRADRNRYEEHRGHYDRLLKQGLFQRSDEKMADCYALTYNDQRSLTHGRLEIGYGYVCSDAERRAIRAWAADVDAPMPR